MNVNMNAVPSRSETQLNLICSQVKFYKNTNNIYLGPSSHFPLFEFFSQALETSPFRLTKKRIEFTDFCMHSFRTPSTIHHALTNWY